MTKPPASLTTARELTAERLHRFPDSPFFTFAARDLDRIEARLASDQPIDRAFYDSLKVGVMCARELEAVDMPFCDAVYALLTDIRPPD